jgi:hypothetical protein
MKMRTPKKIKIPKINTDLAYLCGVLAGDGYIGIRDHKNEYVINCGGNPKDEKEFYDEIIAPLFERLFGMAVLPSLLGKGDTYGIRIYSKNLVTFLLDDVGMSISPKNNLRISDEFLKTVNLTCSFIKGVSDTDFSISLKKGNYPVVSGSSKCRAFMEDIVKFLDSYGFKINKYFDYKVKDSRLIKGYNIINRIEINGHEQFAKWIELIGTNQPKNLKKIDRWKRERNMF